MFADAWNRNDIQQAVALAEELAAISRRSAPTAAAIYADGGLSSVFLTLGQLKRAEDTASSVMRRDGIRELRTGSVVSSRQDPEHARVPRPVRHRRRVALRAGIRADVCHGRPARCRAGDTGTDERIGPAGAIPEHRRGQARAGRGISGACYCPGGASGGGRRHPRPQQCPCRRVGRRRESDRSDSGARARSRLAPRARAAASPTPLHSRRGSASCSRLPTATIRSAAGSTRWPLQRNSESAN